MKRNEICPALTTNTAHLTNITVIVNKPLVPLLGKKKNPNNKQTENIKPNISPPSLFPPHKYKTKKASAKHINLKSFAEAVSE